ncbi:LuxR C-terminal-related transcriptional regulator [Actinoallomurus sp. NPDC052274]|uniref:response regulator transcription factor n=1 Tax=Actinoallomurus sp. NPDC052274 TaxID=3155420 RepID=UPI003435B965
MQDTVAITGGVDDAAVATALAASVREPEPSPREEQTLELIAAGFTHAQVARRRGITKTTVGTYVERIRRKLQVGNKAELTQAALRRQFDADRLVGRRGVWRDHHERRPACLARGSHRGGAGRASDR